MGSGLECEVSAALHNALCVTALGFVSCCWVFLIFARVKGAADYLRVIQSGDGNSLDLQSELVSRVRRVMDSLRDRVLMHPKHLRLLLRHALDQRVAETLQRSVIDSHVFPDFSRTESGYILSSRDWCLHPSLVCGSSDAGSAGSNDDPTQLVFECFFGIPGSADECIAAAHRRTAKFARITHEYHRRAHVSSSLMVGINDDCKEEDCKQDSKMNELSEESKREELAQDDDDESSIEMFVVQSSEDPLDSSKLSKRDRYSALSVEMADSTSIILSSEMRSMKKRMSSVDKLRPPQFSHHQTIQMPVSQLPNNLDQLNIGEFNDESLSHLIREMNEGMAEREDQQGCSSMVFAILLSYVKYNDSSVRFAELTVFDIPPMFTKRAHGQRGMSMATSLSDLNPCVNAQFLFDFQKQRLVRYMDIFGLDSWKCKQETVESDQRRPECKICFSSPINVLLLPCRHCCVCDECLPHLDHCPICRVPIRQTMRWDC